ncbi:MULTISPECIES: Lrp/AsnC family transcriptional regulator [Pseudomonas]|uniref:Lrp/AsnC family transcriptional regulator n=1 Tax=Pseudomonas putida TaxID=303 RepID=A0A3M8TLQ6_PSEPU|nr:MULTISPECIES: Lrp/AsnC family transcriptional regulator [Pseudomonas]MPS98335.1 Lrp/AsnC family transcriptional regulator [Pseudomonas sp.]MQG91123.1 Lrp/AsnC family transcriptional regulator [Pseudomonas sp. MN1F]QUN70086.1 Lrp/AsnC family transcriptional regulator [Pseudomonas sp. JS425]RNF94015.1 Lrp/AsnC family transcriptional regulator [Pseudomonas putida]WOB61218.1 Lrp/AsnC family transcriptional regulator [Pseudomonas sp. NBB]
MNIADLREAPSVTRLQPTGHGPLSEQPLSATDREIIAHLQEDGRRPFVAIARELNISERTVRNRVHQLLEQNVIQIVALTDPASLGFQAGALMGISLDLTAPVSAVAEALIGIAEVDYVVTTTGRFPLFVEIICSDMGRMQRILDSQVAVLQGVKGIEVFPYYSVFYQRAQFFGRAPTSQTPGVLSREMDEVDRKIVRELSFDGRAPLKNIAIALDISESQVRGRLNALLESGLLNIMAITSPMNLEQRALAWVAITVRPGVRVKDVAERLRALDNVSYITICAGRFDLFVEVVCASRASLFELIDDSLRMVEGIERIESFPYIDLLYKRLGSDRV